jgi:hypothetical protein
MDAPACSAHLPRPVMPRVPPQKLLLGQKALVTHKHPIFGTGRSICAQLGLRRSNPHSENLTSN